MIVGGYELQLYCDDQGKYPDGMHKYDEFPHVFNGEFGSEVRQQAR